ncbi:hypothetical protein HPB50_022428 [Hyalomma asiaticum]|uniref:Uncharacterized protein n=1 Tax=Hyalomma asiaticum TaxID=266040 RepID=A0ACB7S931_HYAAI|nr:hypothetical protein HPB50_022428 [Hyalomma asiaticum]
MEFTYSFFTGIPAIVSTPNTSLLISSGGERRFIGEDDLSPVIHRVLLVGASEFGALLQLQLKIAEAETEKHRLILESRGCEPARAEPNDEGESLSLGGRSEEHRRLKFASLLKGVLAPMPNQEALVPMWFEDVEATLDSYDVPAEWWAGLVLPQLSERARGLLCRLKAEGRKVYSKLKLAF